MPQLKTYDLFISHAWRYSDDYTRLETMLRSASLFTFRNYSVPVDKKFENMSDAQLTNELRGQIRPVNVVLIISGMYVAYSRWIQAEIEIAVAGGKPIIGIRPWGSERVPSVVQQAADTMVGWNTNSIVAAIRQYSL